MAITKTPIILLRFLFTGSTERWWITFFLQISMHIILLAHTDPSSTFSLLDSVVLQDEKKKKKKTRHKTKTKAKSKNKNYQMINSLELIFIATDNYLRCENLLDVSLSRIYLSYLIVLDSIFLSSFLPFLLSLFIHFFLSVWFFFSFPPFPDEIISYI